MELIPGSAFEAQPVLHPNGRASIHQNPSKPVREGTGENFNLKDLLLKGRQLRLRDRAAEVSRWYENLVLSREGFNFREVVSRADREVEIIDHLTGHRRKMLMFGSNNYLGLAAHPYVEDRVRAAVKRYGVGVGGPPLLNGYSLLMRQLEERLSAIKKAEDTLIFSSGYAANVGVVTALVSENDMAVSDQFSHASTTDGLKQTGALHLEFRHNSASELERILDRYSTSVSGDRFVMVEGVYSMDGDMARLDEIVPVCRKHGAYLVVDDAHGTGVLGPHGHGVSEHFGVEQDVALNVMTFSKALAMTGGAVSGPKPIIDYLRFVARPYVFSAALPPPVLAAVLAGLDLIENEPHILASFRDNVRYLLEGLRRIGLDVEADAGIIVLRVPPGASIRKAAYRFHEQGIFLNTIEYPAVPAHLHRFRLSVMASHTREDLDRLIACVEEVWSEFVTGGAPQR